MKNNGNNQPSQERVEEFAQAFYEDFKKNKAYSYYSSTGEKSYSVNMTGPISTSLGKLTNPDKENSFNDVIGFDERPDKIKGLSEKFDTILKSEVNKISEKSFKGAVCKLIDSISKELGKETHFFDEYEKKLTTDKDVVKAGAKSFAAELAAQHAEKGTEKGDKKSFVEELATQQKSDKSADKGGQSR